MLSCLSLLRPLLILAPHLTTKWDGYDCLSECLPFYPVCFFFGFYKGDHVIFSVKSGLAGQQAAVCQRNSSIQADGGEVQMDYHTVTHLRVETHLRGVFVYRYYSDIHSAASGCYQEMNSTLTELSGVSEHTKHLNMLL